MATSSTPQGRSGERTLMPGSSPPPALRRPTPAAHGRYMSNRLEREYAVRARSARGPRAGHPPRAQGLPRSTRGAGRARTTKRAAPHGAPACLPDGTRVLLRPIEPADAPQLRAGFDHLDAASRYQRFLTPVAYLTDRQLDYLTHVDHKMHEALVAVDAVTGEGIGIARFVRDARDPARADVAIVVADRWRGRGVGTLLADQLAARARALGVTSFTARMVAGNRAGRRLARAGWPGVPRAR